MGIVRSTESRYSLQIVIGDRQYAFETQTIPEEIGSDELIFSFERTRLDDNPDAAQVVNRRETTLPEQVGDYYLRGTVDEGYYWDLTFFPNPFNPPTPPCIVFGFPDPE